MKNLAVTDVYEPGSVFKIVAASAALEEGLVTPQTTFDCTVTSVDYNGRSRKMPGEAHHFSRETPVSQIVGLSSNRGAAHLAMKLGENRFYSYARNFGFGQKYGFLPGSGEAGGSLPPPSEWDGLTITHMPMGHAVNCTVLQMHQAMSVIANDGVLLRPQIIREIRDAAGETVMRFGRVEVRRVISERTAKTMATLLQGVVSKEGTAPAAAIPGYDVAGKTGTTQKLVEEIGPHGKPTLVYTTKHHVASFVGFFPAGRPQVAISVIVDDADANVPGGVAAGASVAAPSFRRIGDRLISLLNIKSDSQTATPSLVAAFQGGRR
jgi:cell division protein FtsI/penicillin-binding protein 2